MHDDSKSTKEKSQYSFMIPTGLADQDKLDKALNNFRIFLYILASLLTWLH